MSSHSPSPPDGPPPTIDFGGEEQAEQLVRILDQYLAELKAGRKADRAALLAEHPHLAKQLAACLAGLEFIQGVGATSDEAESATAPQRVLGDFRILREVGRGGMGAVYEAEQISLGRRVALKVLRFGGVSDPEALDRFRREAETVARLHHTNIVPVFAVGSEHGVNFYAMQFIDGKSLAEVRGATDEPLDPQQVMQWGLQAAEALAHAHDRNVIHRDVKPSNLLLDQEGRLWLTDFGLARRLDDVTLSMTGALLGTPRYMSPEQASATRQQVDRRTDIYSLGATLYELLAGQPVFSGTSPHQVIQQILSTEATPLQQLRPKVPRDLETVVMKCLAKEPGQRYGSARELADDLRACLEQRPIRARRAGFVEQAVRWVRGRRQGVRTSTYAVAATLLLVAMLAAGGSWYQAWRQSSVLLTTPTPPLTAEFIDTQGNVVAAATVPTERPLVLPDGKYEMRLSSPDRWSQTFQTSLVRGESVSRQVDLDDQQLWMPTSTSHWWSVVDGKDCAALLLWDEQGLVCESGVPKIRRWKTSFIAPRPEAFADAPGLLWPWFKGPESAHFSNGPTNLAPLVTAQTVDVNRDGYGDFIVAARHQALVMALSGVDGKVLWCAVRGADVRKELPPDHDNPRFMRSTTIGAPLVLDDQNGDGVSDLLVTCADVGLGQLIPQRANGSWGSEVPAERWVELMSGATGETLWKRPFQEAWFELANGENVPPMFQWLVGSGFGASNGSVGGSMTLRRHYVRNNRREVSRSGTHTYVSEPVQLLKIEGSTRIAVVAGKHVEWLDPASGVPSSIVEQELTMRPGRPGSWADVDGDGLPEFIYLERRPAAASLGTGSSSNDVAQLVVWSVRQQKPLWSLSLRASFPLAESWTILPTEWPVVADLDGDGRAEVIVPDDNSTATATGPIVEVPWGELVVFDGQTGSPRWRQKIVTCDQQINRIAVGPDIDEDGYRDLFVATLAGLPMKLYLEARSGKTGETLWLTSNSVRTNTNMQDRHVGALRWWNAGEDGWPQLVVSVHHETSSPMEVDAIIVSAATGKVTRKRQQVGDVRTGDIDHDGVEDLLAYRATNLLYPEDGGTVDCVRGIAAEPWNRLGPEGSPVADFNGDGLRDLIRMESEGGLTAICGKSGAVLWKSHLGARNVYSVRSLEELVVSERGQPLSSTAKSWADIDGDGIVDVMFWLTRHFGRPTAMMGVLSGRTGDVLWHNQDLSVRITEGLVDFRVADFDQDGSAELAVIAIADIDYPQSRFGYYSDDLQTWLIVTSIHTGKVRWKMPLSCAYGPTAPKSALLPPAGTTTFPVRTHGQTYRLLAVADLDADGNLDLVTPAIATTGKNLELRAYRGSDGKLLWKHSLPVEADMQIAFAQQHQPRVADIDQDGRVEVLFIERDRSAVTQTNFFLPRIVAIDGATGAIQWRHDGEPRHLTHQAFWMDERRDVSEITLPRAANGKMVPTIFFGGQNPTIMSVENADRAKLTPLSIASSSAASALWCCDVEGDGVDELALISAEKLLLFSLQDPNKPLWSRGSPEASFARILEVHNGTSKRSGEIMALRVVGDNSLIGLDAATGKDRWTCAAPMPRSEQRFKYLQINARLDVDNQAATPHFLFQCDQVTHCRQAIASARKDSDQDAETLFKMSSVSRPIVARPLVSSMGSFAAQRLTRDSRWGRNLPWVAHAGSSPEFVWFCFNASLYALTLVIIPAGFVRRMILRRQWGLRTMFMLPILVAVALLVTTKDWFNPENLSGWERWFNALMATPLLVFIGRMVLWLVQRQWRRTLFWCGVALAVSITIASILLVAESFSNPFRDFEYYVMDDWYFVVDLGFYLTAWIALPMVAIGNLYRRKKEKRKGSVDARPATKPA